MKTMAQVYTCQTEERAQRLNNDICEALKGSFQFRDDTLVVTPVEPIIDQITGEVGSYGFWVYWDTVDIDGVYVNVYPDKHAAVRHNI